MRRGVIVVAVATGFGCGRIGFASRGDALDSALVTSVSCEGLAASCGASADGDCCVSPLVPGGMFYRSFDVASDGMFPDMNNPATVSSFHLDKYEITVGRFRAFVAAGRGTQQDPPVAGAGAHLLAMSGWDASWNGQLSTDSNALVAAVKCDATFQTWTDGPGGNENRPMNCITWYEAMAFCAWDGGFLPTEAEWSFAASGGDEQRVYPWSDPSTSELIDASRASYDDGTGCLGDGRSDCELTDLIVVGSKPNGDGRWGHSELGGNVWEWNLDWWHPNHTTPCMDCAALVGAAIRVFRGGSFGTGAPEVRSASRGSFPPTARAFDIGGRCARP